MKSIFVLLFCLWTTIASAQLELPFYDATSKAVICNADGRYTYFYSSTARIPFWVAYKLTSSDVGGDAGRASSFKVDPALAARGFVSATNDDYYKSGYDKGHLLPSADRSSSVAENRATFLFGNVAPQTPNLNRKAWRLLEEHIRRQSRTCDTIYIVCGGVMNDKMPQIGAGVGVPSHFFKAFMTRTGDEFQKFAYVMPNVDSLATDFKGYAVSVDSVERLTKLQLFYRLK